MGWLAKAGLEGFVIEVTRGFLEFGLELGGDIRAREAAGLSSSGLFKDGGRDVFGQGEGVLGLSLLAVLRLH